MCDKESFLVPYISWPHYIFSLSFYHCVYVIIRRLNMCEIEEGCIYVKDNI
jgi:hypothetical protein